MRSHAAALAFVLVGCASAELARRYEHEGRWEDSYQERVRVADSAGWLTSDAQLAVIHYSLGRAAGVTCRWDEAVKQLQIAYDLDRASGGRSDMDLFELAELYAYREDWNRAVEYYQRGLAEHDQRNGRGPTHPSDQIYVWTKYARALREVGRRAEAETYYQKADELAAFGAPRNPGHATPYGSQCAPGLAQR